MEPLEASFVQPSPGPAVSVALAPAQSLFASLCLLTKKEPYPGFDEWHWRTVSNLPPDLFHRNQLVVAGLYFAIIPDLDWPSFPAFISHLKAQDPARLRDRLFNAYFQIAAGHAGGDSHLVDPAVGDHGRDLRPILETSQSYLDFLATCFPPENLEPEIETQAYTYVKDPPAMQALIVDHFQAMWEQVLEPEWKRALPILNSCVEAFRRVDLTGQSRLEAAKGVLDQPLDDPCWQDEFERAERVVLVPSTHVGPYLMRFRSNQTLWLVFGAHAPKGVAVNAPDLSRTEILVRINALADDTRLRILKLLADEGELRSQDIIERVEISQPVASRHLSQLVATGYLVERRCEGAKCYRLSPERISESLHAVSTFLLGK